MIAEPTSPSGPVVPPPDLPRPDLPQPPVAGAAIPGTETPPGVVAVKIRRESSVEPEEENDDGVASFNTRAVAAVIDLVVFAGLYLGLVWILPGFAESLGWLAGLAYWVARDALPFLGGQSIGKKAMGLKVVTLDGQALVKRWDLSLIRNGALVIPFFALIELYILLTREGKPLHGRRLGDEWAKTRVVVAEDPEPVNR